MFWTKIKVCVYAASVLINILTYLKDGNEINVFIASIALGLFLLSYMEWAEAPMPSDKSPNE